MSARHFSHLVTTDLGSAGDQASDAARLTDGGIVVAGRAGQDFGVVRYGPGQLDPTFGTGGIKLGGFGITAVARGVALTPDGKIELAGYVFGAHGRDFLLARYDEHGNLLASVTTDVLGGDDYAEDLAVDSQGRTVLLGRAFASGSVLADLALVRYTPALAPDTSFDSDGIVTADFHGRGDFGEDVALDSLGRIVAAGYAANGSATQFALLRANP